MNRSVQKSQPSPARPEPPISDSEEARLEALGAFALMDTPPERLFDDITLLASTICRTPIALMSLVDRNRQWFKSKVGLLEVETPRADAFCAYTLLGSEVMIVEDARKDARFSQNPLVVGSPHIRFYAGAPLLTSEGHGLGSLCVIDRRPRRLSPEQSASLQTLANLILKLMEARRLEDKLAAAGKSPSEEILELLPICAECNIPRSDDKYWQKVRSFVHKHGNKNSKACLCPDCARMLD